MAGWGQVKKFAGPLAQGVGSRACVPGVVLISLRARKGAALGGIRQGNSRVEVALKSRCIRAAPGPGLKNSTEKRQRIPSGF